MNENLDLLFTDFSEDATIGGNQVKVIYSSDRELITFSNDIVSSENVYLLAKEADIPTLKVRDTLTIRSNTTNVIDIWRSGNGLAAIFIGDSL